LFPSDFWGDLPWRISSVYGSNLRPGKASSNPPILGNNKLTLQQKFSSPCPRSRTSWSAGGDEIGGGEGGRTPVEAWNLLDFFVDPAMGEHKMQH
jgi:hypothetical protein